MTLVRTEDGNYLCPDDPGEPGYPIHEKRRSVTDEEGEILAGLASGQHVIEIGTGLAVATRYMARTALMLVTVDVDSWVTDPGIANVMFVRDVPQGQRFDFAFIDGNHQYAAVMQDIARVNADSIALHDAYIDGVRRAALDSGLHEVTAYPTRCSLTLYRR